MELTPQFGQVEKYPTPQFGQVDIVKPEVKQEQVKTEIVFDDDDDVFKDGQNAGDVIKKEDDDISHSGSKR